ncbi:helix-turn-helix domain-containing protein [Kitasatospora sp. CM 4170]|uniref:Helix-turn-helix domain-containing protein n=1 Tax=Kitasatospora aburaviensis TaxID=67265 RepID=A0ABW1F1P4_9ACTN|nr:helix-turn-helix domain-containing protein [Kitasatospora sp. CM 4170]WNM45495.1 helix-turn-helix domain-containing protein [Kitasatospora sp. CM 4170]
MHIHRIPQHPPGYTILDNGHVVRKHSLSWAARGLLGYLLSLPDGSREDVRTLAAKSVEGRATVARALRELEEAGHYIRRTHRDPVTGQVRTVVSVHEVPMTGKAVHAMPPLPVPPADGRPGAGPTGGGNAGSPSVKEAVKDAEEPSVPPSERLTVKIAPPRPQRATEGMALLLELGRRNPRFALAGKPLNDQAARVEGLLAGGWTADALTSILAAPLPERITHSVGAIVSARLSAVPPVPRGERIATTHSPSAVGHECPGRDGLCGRPVAMAGRVCPACQAG